MAAHSLLKDVNETSQHWRIRTRIGRLWEHRDKNNKIIMLHMVLVDEKGEGIHASVHKRELAEYSPKLKEGQLYCFHRFRTSRVNVNTKHRPVRHHGELHFGPRTMVTLIQQEPAGFPLFTYHPMLSRDILSTVMDKTYLADIVGIVRGISDIMTSFCQAKPKRTVRLFDGRNDAIIHLWGDLATQLSADELIHRSQSEPVILLAMGCTFNMKDSMLSLSSGYGCRICTDLAISDVSAFRNSIIRIDHSIERIDDSGQRLGALAVENTSVTNLVPEDSSSGAGHTGSRVDAVSAGDPAAEPTVSASQEHNAGAVNNPLSEGSSSGAGHTGSRVDVVSAGDPAAEPTVSASQEHNDGTVSSLVSECSSSGAGHTGSLVDVVSAGDPVAEPTVSAAQEHNADLSSSVDMESQAIDESDGGEMPGTPAVGKNPATPPGDVSATTSDLKRKTRSSSMGRDNQRGQIEEVKKKPPKRPKLTSNKFILFQNDFKLKYKLARPNEKNINNAVINKEATEKWNCMTEDEKSPYTSRYKGHLVVYKTLMAEYKRLLNERHLAEYERHVAEYEMHLAECNMENVPGIEIENFTAEDAFEHLLASVVDKPEGGHTVDHEEVVDKPEGGHTVDQEEVEHGHDESTSEPLKKFIAVFRQHGVLGLVAPQVRGGFEVQQALQALYTGN